MKNEEISNFICTLKQNLDNLEVRDHVTEGHLIQVSHSFAMLLCRWVLETCRFTLFLSRHQANSSRVQEDLESEFTGLHSVLDEMKENMLTRIKQERASRTYELQVTSGLDF